MTFGGVWDDQANWITADSYGPSYTRYGDMLMVYLSSVAPDYRQPIQTMGFSTGNKPAMEVAWYVNATYKDARYAVNRVALLDAVCSNLSTSVAQFHTNRVGGEQCWVDNYISNDPNYARRPILPGALNIVCNPARGHSYPLQRYGSSSLEYTNGGLTAFAYLSVIGRGKNYQLNTASQKYYFVINSAESIVFFNQSLYPGKILAPVRLTGPADGDTLGAGGVAFSCEPVENAVGYQLLFGSDPDRVMDYNIISDTPNPPSQIMLTLPLEHTWWTVRAYDQFGSTIHADPRLIKLPENRRPVADAGPDRVLHAGLDGKATVVLNGSASTDPDGDALGYTWAWAIGTNNYLSNGVSLTIELPIGVHTIQLMVNDGRTNSEVATVSITVRPMNQPPMADASATTPLLIVPPNCSPKVVLDGSRSSDPDGDTLQYLWFKAGEHDVLATGVVAVVTLPLGTNFFTLVVDDGQAIGTNAVTVTALTAGEAIRGLIQLVDESNIRRPRPLLAILSAAANSLHRPHPHVTIMQLRAFQHLAQVACKRQDPALASELVEAAQQVIEALKRDCGPSRSRCKIAKLHRRADGRLRLEFSSPHGPTYLVEASTNLVDWEKVGVAVESRPGEFEFEDPEAPRAPVRFYRLVSPD